MAARPRLIFSGVSGPSISLATDDLIKEYGSEEQPADLSKIGIMKSPEIPKIKKALATKDKPLAVKPLAVKQSDLSVFGEATPYAINIRAEEEKNPYKIPEDTVFPLQTRLGFQTQILKVFSDFIKIPEFGKEPDFDACKKMGAAAGAQVEMYEYQKFVREYVRQATPYKGILVYHGLGSGKTCSAIAAAEALFSVTNKKIIVMTPSSLRYNFIREISFCGFRHYRLQNHWEQLSLSDPTIKLFATQILGLPDSYLKKAVRVWVPDFKQESNFNSLVDEERREITAQMEAQITNRIQFLNYNGLTSSKLKQMACAPVDDKGYGFFDNSVIIVDEIHNLTRLMQGTIEPYLTSLPNVKGRKIPLEPITPGHWEPELCKKPTDPRKPYLTNYKRGYLFYRLLSGARNSKLIGLSGTPLINFPEEIAILTNLIGGYIHTCSFVVTPATEENMKKIKTILHENPYVDFEEVDLLGTNINVLFTGLPEGLIKEETNGQVGVRRVDPSIVTPTLVEISKTVISSLTGMRVIQEPKFKSEPLLPPIGDEFRKHFLDGSKLTNTVVLRKRLQGLISYYRGSKKELMPTVTVDTVINVPLSPYAQAEYQRVRAAELKIQMEQKKDSSETGGKMANLWADIYELSKLKQTNSYRMASRQACNFSFPEGIARPRPRDAADAIAEIGEDEVYDEAPEKSLEEEIVIKEEDVDVEAAAKEDEEIDESAKKAALEELPKEEAAVEEKDDATLLISEVAPSGEMAPAVAMPEGKKTLSAAQMALQQQAKKKEECKKGLLPGEKYELATKRAKDCLRIFASSKLRLFPPGQNITEKVKAGESPDPSRLYKYSPKFSAMLVKILEAPGSSLVYSQFLDMEGIGIFSTVLDINDFHRIEILGDESGMRFSPQTIANLKKGKAANRYLTFTGAKGGGGIRNMALKVFNAKFSEGRFTELPPEMSQLLVEAGFTGNLTGELCRVFCITSAGAEGLSLKNVRRVHIMEPFWNHVRTDQVKGRAVRICSHIDLDYSAEPLLNQRTVEVYTYCSTFDPQSIVKPDGSTGFPRIDQTILNNDGLKPQEAIEMGFTVPPGTVEYVITSDQHLLQLSERKKKILQSIQDLMKTNAVDCKINMYENEDEGLGCITLPGTPQQYAFHPILTKDIIETRSRFPESSIVVDKVGSEVVESKDSVEPVAIPAKPKKTIQARIIVFQKVPYLAVPVIEKGQILPLTYDLYARGDLRRVKKLGVSLSDSEGNPTSDIQLF